MQKIAIVTGCAGFLASTFVEKLLVRGWYVYGIDSLKYMANTDQLDYLLKKYTEHYKFVKQDITTIKWLPDCDILFNFAAETDVDNGNKDCSTFVNTNVDGVRNLLELISNKVTIKTSNTLFFQLSTDEVYGDIKEGSFSETSSMKPSNPYAATKAAADLLIQSWARTHNLQYIIARPSNNYGEFQYPEKLIPLAVKQLNRGKRIKLHNNGDPVRTWTHTEDTAEAILLLAEKASKNAVYNISSEYELQNVEVLIKILDYFGIKDYYLDTYADTSYNRPGQDIRYSISCSPLKKLGWKATRNFDTELSILVKKYKKEFNW